MRPRCSTSWAERARALSAGGARTTSSCDRRRWSATARRRRAGTCPPGGVGARGRPGASPPARGAGRSSPARGGGAGDAPPLTTWRARRCGASPARHRISSAIRLPTPARRRWSMRRAFTATALCSRAWCSSAGDTDAASGPRSDSSGSSSTPPSSRGSCTTESAPVGEAHGEAVPGLVPRSLAYRSRSTPAKPSTTSLPVIPNRRPAAACRRRRRHRPPRAWGPRHAGVPRRRGPGASRGGGRR